MPAKSGLAVGNDHRVAKSAPAYFTAPVEKGGNDPSRMPGLENSGDRGGPGHTGFVQSCAHVDHSVTYSNSRLIYRSSLRCSRYWVDSWVGPRGQKVSGARCPAESPWRGAQEGALLTVHQPGTRPRTSSGLTAPQTGPVPAARRPEQFYPGKPGFLVSRQERRRQHI